MNNSDTYYTINSSDFTPLPGRDTFANKRIKSLTYIDEPTTVKLDANGNHLEGIGYGVEAFTLMNADGTNLQTFTTAEYRQNPAGVYTHIARQIR